MAVKEIRVAHFSYDSWIFRNVVILYLVTYNTEGRFECTNETQLYTKIHFHSKPSLKNVKLYGIAFNARKLLKQIK